jgi:hypothetical protein
MGENIVTMNDFLSSFLTNSLPDLKAARARGTMNLSSLSTIAIFLSGVTATTLQMSFAASGNPLQETVNTFYFASLILSITAAVNSLIASAWKQAR